MKQNLVKCEKCGTYNDLSEFEMVDSFSSEEIVKIICEKCGEKIDI